MHTLKIDVTKIDKTALFKGAKGTYLDLVLIENRDGVDQYGNHGFIKQDIGKERREKGENGPIIGNWKHVGGTIPNKPSQHQQAKQSGYQPQPAEDQQEEDDILF